jgi:hypothetical protein
LQRLSVHGAGCDPQRIPLLEASGGFSSVVQLASSVCLAHLAVTSPLLRVSVPITRSQLDSALPKGGLYDTPGLATAAPSGNATLVVGFQPFALRFLAGGQLHLTYAGGVELWTEPAETFISDEDRGALEELVMSGSLAGSPLGAGLPVDVNTTLIVDLLRRLEALSEQITVTPISGSLRFDVEGAYESVVDSQATTVDVRVNLDEHSFSAVSHNGDAGVLWTEFLANQLGALQYTLASSRLALVPTISPFGTRGSIPTTEISQFNPTTFHVDLDKDQALALGFDLAPGGAGTPDAVRHFLCGADYGILSDEYLISANLRYRWRLGGFSRTLGFDAPVRIRREDGREEDARVIGRAQLRTLDSVSLMSDANKKFHVIRLAGVGTPGVDEVRLSTGETVAPEHVDAGPAVDIHWAFITHPTLVEELDLDPLVALFQQRAARDAYRHLVRPFAAPVRTYDPAQPQYVRLDAVGQRFLSLGTLSSPLI